MKKLAYVLTVLGWITMFMYPALYAASYFMFLFAVIILGKKWLDENLKVVPFEVKPFEAKSTEPELVLPDHPLNKEDLQNLIVRNLDKADSADRFRALQSAAKELDNEALEQTVLQKWDDWALARVAAARTESEIGKIYFGDCPHPGKAFDVLFKKKKTIDLMRILREESKKAV